MKNFLPFASFLLAILSSPALGAGRDETAVLAGGCYWGMEAVFDHVAGVKEAVSGFAGAATRPIGRDTGDSSSPAEAVRITFDPTVVSYEQLLDIFFSVAHDPSQLDRQGPDVGHQYRSAIFPQSKAQREAAMRTLSTLRTSGRYARITTTIENGGFRSAPPEEQQFVAAHPQLPYVIVNDLPKLQHLKQRYPKLWKA